MKKSYQLLVTLFFINSSFASEHQFNTLATYQYQENEDIGFNLSYQYYFKPNFAVEFGYDQSGELAKRLSDQHLVGEFDSLFLGGAIRKPINAKFDTFASGGIMYVTQSTNEYFLAEQSTVPYLGLGIQYYFTDNFALTLKHQSQFSNQDYKDMHNFSLGFSFRFGSSSSKALPINQTLPEPIYSTKPTVTLQQPTQVKTVDSTTTPPVTVPVTIASTVESPNIADWGVQIASFKHKTNAQDFLAEFNELTETMYAHKFSILQHKNLYRVIALTFTSREAAKAWATKQLSPKQINHYVLHIANNH